MTTRGDRRDAAFLDWKLAGGEGSCDDCVRCTRGKLGQILWASLLVPLRMLLWLGQRGPNQMTDSQIPCPRCNHVALWHKGQAL